MTKLADILNDYYATERMTVTEHIKAITETVSKDEMDAELISLFRHLETKV